MKQNKEKNKTSNRLRIILLTFVAAILGLAVYNWNAGNLMGDKMPMPLGFGLSVVLSGSMEPTLSVNDLVVIKKTDSVQVDDVVVFQDGNVLVIHRVVAIDGDEIVTRGDANNTVDDPVSITHVKGIMVFAIPFLGAAIQFLKHPVVVVFMVVAAAYLANRSFRKEKERDADELDDIKKEIEELISEMKENSK